MDKLKVYVAGPSASFGVSELLIALLEQSGCEVTYNWVPEVREFFKKKTGMLDENEATAIAEVDLDAVIDAHLIVIHYDDTIPSAGSPTELGAALALNKPVIVYSPQYPDFRRVKVFLWHPGVFAHVESPKELLEQIRLHSSLLNTDQWDQSIGPEKLAKIK